MMMARAEAEQLAESVPREPYYAGGWRGARSAAAFDVVDPVTERCLATVAEAGPVEVDEAVCAARSAVADGTWGRIDGAGRGRLLNRVADLLEARSEEFAALESLDVGKAGFEPRAIDLPQAVRTFRHFAGWADKVTGRSIPTPGYMGRPTVSYTVREPAGVVAAITPWNSPTMIAAWKVAPDLGVELEVLAPGDEHLRIRAEYVVAADGGRSTIRDLLGVPLEGDTHPRKWVVIESDTDPLDAPYTGLHCDPARPYVSIRLPHDYRRWEFMLFPGEDSEEMLKPGKVRELLTRHVEDPAQLNIIRARIYTHHSRIAQRFTVGRVCLAGDAAHLMPPWAGQGLNTGIRDATNVAWKIAAVIKQRADPSILATYDTERRPHAQAMIDLSTTLGRILSPTDRRVAAARDLAFGSIARTPAVKNWILQMRFKPMARYVNGLVTSGGHGRNSPLGRMFIQPLVENAHGRTVRLDDTLGPWFAVLGFGAEPAGHLTDAQRDYLTQLDASLIKVTDSRAGRGRPTATHPGTHVIEDLEGHLRAWFTQHATRFVVIRPDRYVAAHADETSLGAAIDGLRGMLEPGGTVRSAHR